MSAWYFDGVPSQLGAVTTALCIGVGVWVLIALVFYGVIVRRRGRGHFAASAFGIMLAASLLAPGVIVTGVPDGQTFSFMPAGLAIVHALLKWIPGSLLLNLASWFVVGVLYVTLARVLAPRRPTPARKA